MLAAVRAALRSLLGRARRAIGPSSIEVSSAAEEEPEEEMVVQAVLPEAAASMALDLQQTGRPAGAVEILIRSDFYLRRTDVRLLPCTVWALSDTPRAAGLVMEALCSRPLLSGAAEWSAFEEGISGNVRCINLLPDRPGSGAFAVTAQMVIRMLQHGRGHDGQQAKSTEATGQVESEYEGSQSRQTTVMRRAELAAAPVGFLPRLWSAGAVVKGAAMESLRSGLTWAGIARRNANSVASDLRSGFDALRHRYLWQQLQQQPKPQLLIVCLSKSAGLQSMSLRSKSLPGSVDRQATRSQTQGGSAHEGVSAPSFAGFLRNNWGRDGAAAQALVEAARASKMSVLTVALTSGPSSTGSPAAQRHEASSSVLMLSDSGGRLPVQQAWQLKMAVYRALTGIFDRPVLQSKL
jgi:hypothetical protein